MVSDKKIPLKSDISVAWSLPSALRNDLQTEQEAARSVFPGHLRSDCFEVGCLGRRTATTSGPATRLVAAETELGTIRFDGGLDPTCTRWVPCNFIPAAYLKKHWKTHFIGLIKQCWYNKSWKIFHLVLPICLIPATKTKLSLNLWILPGLCMWEKNYQTPRTVRYIGRYTKRPAIAESRITAYDGKTVTFNFVDHKTEKLTFHTLPVQQFIGKLILHITDINCRIILYSGFYANRVRGDLLPKVFTILRQDYEKAKQKLAKLASWWRTQIERFTKLDPLISPLI